MVTNAFYDKKVKKLQNMWKKKSNKEKGTMFLSGRQVFRIRTKYRVVSDYNHTIDRVANMLHFGMKIDFCNHTHIHRKQHGCTPDTTTTTLTLPYTHNF